MTLLEARLAEVGRLVARLHTAGAPPRSFIHIRDYVASWEIPHRDEQEG